MCGCVGVWMWGVCIGVHPMGRGGEGEGGGTWFGARVRVRVRVRVGADLPVASRWRRPG